jgi:hypothetical protein
MGNFPIYSHGRSRYFFSDHKEYNIQIQKQPTGAMSDLAERKSQHGGDETANIQIQKKPTCQT